MNGTEPQSPWPAQWALTALLDDPSAVVHAAMVRQLRAMGPDGLAMLRGVVDTGEASNAQAARQYLLELGAEHPREQFLRLIRSFNFELESGVLMLARVIDPELDAADCYTFMEEAAGRCRQLLLEPATTWQKCRVLNRVLFHEYGFSGDRADFFNPANCLIHEVIRRRRGIPISLCTVYLLVAARCGIDLELVATPGRLLIGCFDDIEPFYIDAFEGGVFLGVEDVERFLEQQTIVPEPSHFAPAAVSDILQRYCRNLVVQYQKQGEPERARLFEEFVVEFDRVHSSDDV